MFNLRLIKEGRNKVNNHDNAQQVNIQLLCSRLNAPQQNYLHLFSKISKDQQTPVTWCKHKDRQFATYISLIVK